MRLMLILAMMALLASTSSFAQYRYVSPDGTVSYSDTPPVGPASRVTVQSSPESPAPAAGSPLPYVLNQATSRFPVTLYTTGNCASCDAARTYLKQRGVPYAEKTVSTDADIAVIKRISGGDALPVVVIGSQKSLGYSQAAYADMLNDAGYPPNSTLPRDYVYPAPMAASGVKPTPVAPADNATASSSAPPAVQMAEPPPAQNAPPGFKF